MSNHGDARYLKKISSTNCNDCETLISPRAVKRSLGVHEHDGHLPARPARLHHEHPGPHEDAGRVPVRAAPPVESLERAVLAAQPGVGGGVRVRRNALGVQVVEVAEEEIQQEGLAAAEGA